MQDISQTSIQLSLVVPTFNERDNLRPLVERVQKALTGRSYELIIVDDDSPDKTWQLGEEMATQDPRVRVVRRQNQRGLATAVASGWKIARGSVLGVMDGDLQYPPELLPQLLQALDDMSADIAVASRYVPGATVERWGLLRKLNSWGARLLARLALPGVSSEIRDPGAGCFVMRRQVIENVELRPIGYKILIEVLARGRYVSIIELPHDYRGRAEGQSKLDLRQQKAFLSHLVRLAGETGEFRRVLRSCTVELFSVLATVGVFWLLTKIYQFHYLFAGAVAVEFAIANNFLWNEVWTFADKTRESRTPRHRLERFFHFNNRCVIGALLALGVLWLVTNWLDLHSIPSAVMALGVAILWNHNVHAKNTWVSRRAQFRENGWYTAVN